MRSANVWKTSEGVLNALSLFSTVCPTEWQGKPIPERRWLVPGLLVRGSVTLLNGDGGIGKVQLAPACKAPCPCVAA